MREAKFLQNPCTVDYLRASTLLLYLLDFLTRFPFCNGQISCSVIGGVDMSMEED